MKMIRVIKMGRKDLGKFYSGSKVSCLGKKITEWLGESRNSLEIF